LHALRVKMRAYNEETLVRQAIWWREQFARILR